MGNRKDRTKRLMSLMMVMVLIISLGITSYADTVDTGEGTGGEGTKLEKSIEAIKIEDNAENIGLTEIIDQTKPVELIKSLEIIKAVEAADEISIADERQEAANRLAEADIVKGDKTGNLKLDKPITRAELTALVFRAINEPMTLEMPVQVFSDVAPEDWFFIEVTKGSQRGLVAGYSEGDFRPNNNVQYREALSIVLRALGHTNESLGGQWPSNYVAKADRLGLTLETDWASQASAYRGDILLLLDAVYDYDNKTFKSSLKNSNETGVVEEKTEEAMEVVQPIGIISAMQSELDLLVSKTEVTNKKEIGGTTYYEGILEGKPVVLVKAGVGKSLASAGTAILINEFNVKNVWFTGIAGGVGDDVKVLDMVISTDLLIHDYGTIGKDGFEWNGKAGVDKENGLIPSDVELRKLAYAAAVRVAGEENTHQGVIVTGDQFVGSEAYVKKLSTKFKALATEMEGAAVARVANEFDIPVIVIRSMSDKADGVARESMDNFGQKAADMSAEIVMEMLRNIK